MKVKLIFMACAATVIGACSQKQAALVTVPPSQIDVEKLMDSIDYNMDVSGLSIADVRTLRNAPAAKRGYPFKDSYLRGVYHTTTWYDSLMFALDENLPWDKFQNREDEPWRDFYYRVVDGQMKYSAEELDFMKRLKEREEELKKQGTLIVFRLAYNSDMELEESHPNVQTVDCFYAASHRKWVLGNMTLCFGYFRGRDVKDLDGNTVSYPQDLVVGCNLYRWDEQEAKPVCLTSILQSDRYTVPADAIMAVQTKKGDKESLVYFEHDHLFCSSSWPRSNSKLCERWLDTDGKTVKSKSDFGSSLFGWTDSQMTRFLNMETNQETNAHPVLCKFADRERPMKFKFKSHELNFSEPRIYAVIAAPPYYKDLGPGGATTWGKSSTTSNSTATSDEWGGSVIAGYEHSYSVPFFSSAEVGVEFTAKVSVAGGIADEHEVTMGSGQEYSVSEGHSVVMQATPFDTYRYEIIDSADPDEEGMEFVVSMPRERTFKLMTLPTYVRLMASQKNVARPQRFLTSTPGNPWSYPMNYDNEIKFVDDAHPFLKGKDMNQGYTNESVPDGIGNSATRSLSMATSDSKTKSVSLEVETELVATVGGAKAGVGFNYGHTKENTHTIGQEFSVGGTVSGIPYNDPDHPEFKWNVVWYYVKDAGGIYPVVNYIVTR